MAFVYELRLPAEDLERISKSMQPGYEGGAPELSASGSAVLERVRAGQQMGMWKIVVGRLEEHAPLGAGECDTPTEGVADDAYSLIDGDGDYTGRRVQVVEDLQTPDDAFAVGIPVLRS